MEMLSVSNTLYGNAISANKSVKAATTTAGTLATSFENGDIIDGITLITGDRILIKNQASGIENGIYTVNATGSPSRTADFDVGISANGIFVSIIQGTQNGNSHWICTSTPSVDIVGTDTITFNELTSNSSKLQTIALRGPASNIDISGGATPITWNTEDIEDPAFTHTGTSSDITINQTGRYSVDSNILGYAPNVTGEYVSLTQIYIDSGSGFAPITSSLGMAYHQAGGPALQLRSAAANVVNMSIAIASGSIVRIDASIIYASSVGTSVIIAVNQSRLSIKKV